MYVRMFILTLDIVLGGWGQTGNTLFHQICLRPKAVCSVSVYDTTVHSHTCVDTYMPTPHMVQTATSCLARQ